MRARLNITKRGSLRRELGLARGASAEDISREETFFEMTNDWEAKARRLIARRSRLISNSSDKF